MRPKIWISVLLLAILLVGAYYLSQRDQPDLILADSSISWWMAPTIVAHEKMLDDQDFYTMNGIKVSTFDMQTGLASKNALLSGSADLGIVASTPLASGLQAKEDLLVLCSFVDSYHLLALLTPSDTIEPPHYSPPEAPVALVEGTISQWYFLKYVRAHFREKGYENALKVARAKPADIQNLLRNQKSAKSASIWEPYVTQIARKDPNLRINRDTTLYEHRIYLVTRPSVWKAKHKTIKLFIRSLQAASDYIRSNRELVQKRLMSKFPEQKESMESLWEKVDFSIKFDYANMKKLIYEDAETLQLVDTLATTPDSARLNSLFDEAVYDSISHNE
jgi:ABC-type nitrate/sulfonate/bicarbonate transport system substrate-binding protein